MKKNKLFLVLSMLLCSTLVTSCTIRRAPSSSQEPSEEVSSQLSTNEESSVDPITSEESSFEEESSEETTSENISSEDITSIEESTEEVSTSEELSSEEESSEETTSEEVSSEDISSIEESTEEVGTSEESSSEEESSEELSSENPVTSENPSTSEEPSSEDPITSEEISSDSTINDVCTMTVGGVEYTLTLKEDSDLTDGKLYEFEIDGVSVKNQDIVEFFINGEKIENVDLGNSGDNNIKPKESGSILSIRQTTTSKFYFKVYENSYGAFATGYKAEHHWYVTGSITDWELENVLGFVTNENAEHEVQLTDVKLEAGDEIKIKNRDDDSGWYGYESLKEGCQFLVTGENGSNIRIKHSGTYDFYWDYDTNKLWISRDFEAQEGYLYLAPNANWTSDNQRFAAYFFGNGELWVNMTYNEEFNVYECQIPEGGYTSVIFCRMNGGTSENNWDNKWNQTGDLKLTDNNFYTVPYDAWNDSDDSHWSKK